MDYGSLHSGLPLVAAVFLALAAWGQARAESGPDGGPPWERFRTDHPRLFFNRNTFPVVRARALGPEREWFDNLRRRCDAMTGKAHPVRDHGGLAASAAFVHLVTGEERYLTLATGLLQRSIAYYRDCDRNNRSVNWYSTSRINAIAAYDWVYNFLSSEERRRLGRELLAHVDAVQPGRGKPTVHRRNTSSYTTGFYGTPSLLWYAGVATLGAGIDDARARDFTERGYDLYVKTLEHRRRATGDDGGAASPSLNYAWGAYPWAEFNFFHTMQSAFETDIAPQWPYVAHGVYYFLWNRLPGRRWFGSGDAYHDTNALPTWQTYTHLAQIRHFYGRAEPECAALAHWMQKQLEHQGYTSTWPCHPFLLTGLEQSPGPRPAGVQPLARHFESMGQIFMRSGDGPDDTYALFTAGGILAQHKHFDENNFVIFKQGFLALDSGTRPEPGSHLFQYYCRTVAHNCVLVRMEGERLPRYWGSRAPGEPDLPPANDGGMNRQVGAKMLAFETLPQYAYIASDATPCYNAEKCALALRQFVFVPPDHFVIFDRVVSRRPEYGKTWLLHTAREPKIEGDTFAAEHEQGRLFCRTLLPTDASIIKVGGPGRQFWNDGRNWPLPKGWRITDDTELLGQWRIKVSPGTSREADEFLHLIQVGDRRNLTGMDEARLISTDAHVGVEFNSMGRTVAVLFGLGGDPSGRITMTGGARPVARNFTTEVRKQAGLTGEAP